MNNILAGINFWVVVAIVGVFIVILIVLFFLTKKGKFKRNLKRREKKIEKEKSKLSQANIERLTVNIFKDESYKGTLKSFNSENKKDVKKFIKQFVDEVCDYTIIKDKYDENVYSRVGLTLTRTQEELQNYKHLKKKMTWFYVFKYKTKKNYKNLLRLINKNKVVRGSVDVLTRVYRHYKNKEEFPDIPQAFENNLYITYFSKHR